jgi:hypothetical protein
MELSLCLVVTRLAEIPRWEFSGRENRSLERSESGRVDDEKRLQRRRVDGYSL